MGISDHSPGLNVTQCGPRTGRLSPSTVAL